MQVILQGSLRHFPPAELLSFLCARAQKGTIDFETPGKRTRVVFDGDKIVWAESSRDALGADAILDVLEWNSGNFTLLDSAVVPENVRTLTLELPKLLDEAKRRAEEASLYADSTMFHVVENPAMQQVSLNNDQLRLLFRLTAGRSFKQLVDEFGLPRRELHDRLKHLEKVGLITVADEPKAKEKEPSLSRKITLVGSLTPDSAPDNVYPLLDAEHSIGRLSSNSIPITDGSVSSTHARIVKTPEGFVIEDLNSRNGTFVNGEKITEKRLLVDGDLIRLGKVIMTFNLARDIKTGEVTQPEVRVT